MEDYTNINWDSIAKGVAGELSPEELLQMQNELKDAPEAENIMKEINDIWDAVEYADELKEINTDAAWIAVKEDISRRSRWRKKRTFISIAATLVLLLGSYLTLHYLGFYGTETLVANNGIANVRNNFV